MRRSGGQRDLEILLGITGEREPVRGWESDAPDVAGSGELDADLEKFANGAGTLDPGDAPFDHARRSIGFAARNLNGHLRGFGDVMLGLIFAAVAVHGNGGGAFFEGLP